MMRQECNSRFHYNNRQNKSAIFLPMLCSRPSIIKDVQALRRPNDMSSSSSSSADPLSPRITCIGQVKRKNKVVVFPTTTAKLNDVKHSKLRRFFSGKNLAAEGRGHVVARGGGAVSVVDLDPPLPVVKRPINPAQLDEPVQSLWKRRSGGATTLKTLQLRRAHHPAHHLQPTTV